VHVSLFKQIQDGKESLVLPEAAILSIGHCAANVDGQLIAVIVVNKT